MKKLFALVSILSAVAAVAAGVLVMDVWLPTVLPAETTMLFGLAVSHPISSVLAIAAGICLVCCLSFFRITARGHSSRNWLHVSLLLCGLSAQIMGVARLLMPILDGYIVIWARFVALSLLIWGVAAACVSFCFSCRPAKKRGNPLVSIVLFAAALETALFAPFAFKPDILLLDMLVPTILLIAAVFSLVLAEYARKHIKYTRFTRFSGLLSTAVAVFAALTLYGAARSFFPSLIPTLCPTATALSFAVCAVFGLCCRFRYKNEIWDI